MCANLNVLTSSICVVADPCVQGRAAPEHDPGRRRRSDQSGAREVPPVPQGHQRSVRGDHHRSPQPVQDVQDWQAQGPRHQRQRLCHQVKVR